MLALLRKSASSAAPIAAATRAGAAAAGGGRLGGGGWCGTGSQPSARGLATSADDEADAPEAGRPATPAQGRGSLKPMFETKVSPSGSPDALFQEAIDAIRQRRAELQEDPVFQQVETSAVTKLKQDELELTRKVFQRIDPERDLTSDFSSSGHDIDPYWSPFHQLRDVKEQVTAEFDEYSRYVSVAEAKRVRVQIKRSLKRSSQVYNPYSDEFRKWHGREKGFEQVPKPFRLPDQYWERTPLQERLNREKITWRDVDIIQHFIADNGCILPRRTTMLTRPQQKKLVKAVQKAQMMSLLPYQRKLQDYQAMPLTDPLQWMVERLTDRLLEHRDRRSRAMLQVMMERYPELHYGRFLKHEAKEGGRAAHEARGGGSASVGAAPADA